MLEAAFTWLKNNSKNGRNVNYYYNLKQVFFLFEYMLKCNLFLWCAAEFSASLLQSSVSHDPSEIILICWFAAQETFFKINVEHSCAASYFLNITFIFRIPFFQSSIKKNI